MKMAGVIRLYRNLLSKRILQPVLINSRTISTSNKNRDTATVAKSEVKSEEVKNWVSYGFDFKDAEADRRATHSIFFFAITLCVVTGGFIWTYIPDYQMRDWAQREAYLEIRRRERAGLPLIDPNLVDPSRVELPSDEDLGDTEIII